MKNVYLIGIGGIGMSALARYLKSQGKNVAGYDRTPTSLTEELVHEGMIIHYDDSVNQIPKSFQDSEHTLIIYTPAVADDHEELMFFRSNNFNIKKRAEVLGLISKEKKAIAISGTHGKTTTTSMTAHIMKQSSLGCNAFLGGILKNYNSNLILSANSEYVVVEADEYDRSFLQLSPTLTIVTSIDAEHLDIYGTKEAMIETYHEFLKKIKKGGTLIYKKESNAPIHDLKDITIYSYSILSEEASFHIRNLSDERGFYSFDLHTPKGILSNIKMGMPGYFNVENAVAAIAATYLLGVEEDVIKKAISTFQGAKRRFDYQINTEKIVYIDDYAHHPEELKACISSARKIYKDKKITGIFQPHLFSRTKDFYKEFAESLSLLDDVYLLDIYPAREQPIPGITSEIIFDKITSPSKMLCSMDKLLADIEKKDFDVVITMGAGNIDKLIQPLKEILLEKAK